MSVKVLCEYDDLKAIADAIRTKSNTTEAIKLTEIPTEIGVIGGASIETCTVIFKRSSPTPDIPIYYFTDANMMSQSISERNGTVTVPKNTIIAVTGWTTMSTHSGNCTQIFNTTAKAAYLISGDSTLTYMG